MGEAADEDVNVVGCLCTPLDRLGDRVALPHAVAGDVIAIFLAGAYGASASPAGLLSHPPAREMLARSAEPTYELQYLMRISYAVFCLKKKKITLKRYHANETHIKQQI